MELTLSENSSFSPTDIECLCQAIENGEHMLERLRSKVRKVSDVILVLGRKGVGKSTFINFCFGEEIAAVLPVRNSGPHLEVFITSTSSGTTTVVCEVPDYESDVATWVTLNRLLKSPQVGGVKVITLLEYGALLKEPSPFSSCDPLLADALLCSPALMEHELTAFLVGVSKMACVSHGETWQSIENFGQLVVSRYGKNSRIIHSLRHRLFAYSPGNVYNLRYFPVLTQSQLLALVEAIPTVAKETFSDFPERIPILGLQHAQQTLLELAMSAWDHNRTQMTLKYMSALGSIQSTWPSQTLNVMTDKRPHFTWRHCVMRIGKELLLHISMAVASVELVNFIFPNVQLSSDYIMMDTFTHMMKVARLLNTVSRNPTHS